jgi:hypothetical protein
MNTISSAGESHYVVDGPGFPTVQSFYYVFTSKGTFLLERLLRSSQPECFY